MKSRRHLSIVSVTAWYHALLLLLLPTGGNVGEAVSTSPGGSIDGSTDDGQFCMVEGVCFANENEAHKYYGPGQDVKINYGVSQRVEGNDWKLTLQVVQRAEAYMEKSVYHNSSMDDVRAECLSRNKLCSFWASIGECEKNPNYMLLQCAPSCQTCHQLKFDHRCPWDKSMPSAWQPGDLNKMFERITTDEYYVTNHQPTILSQPPGPWIVTLENVVHEDECERLIELGKNLGYKRSQDVGKKQFDGTFDGVESKKRTSSNAWCVENCYNDTLNLQVVERVENITGIPDKNSEYWQLLQYTETQFYGHHHDYINFHNDRPQGVRMLTVFLYLNDVEEGGQTRFTDMKITVEAKRGRALIWPSVLDHRPTQKDPRTHHEAMPVIKGIKYGANAWIHERDFKTPFGEGCS